MGGGPDRSQRRSTYDWGLLLGCTIGLPFRFLCGELLWTISASHHELGQLGKQQARILMPFLSCPLAHTYPFGCLTSEWGHDEERYREDDGCREALRRTTTRRKEEGARETLATTSPRKFCGSRREACARGERLLLGKFCWELGRARGKCQYNQVRLVEHIAVRSDVVNVKICMGT